MVNHYVTNNSDAFPRLLDALNLKQIAGRCLSPKVEIRCFTLTLSPTHVYRRQTRLLFRDLHPESFISNTGTDLLGLSGSMAASALPRGIPHEPAVSGLSIPAILLISLVCVDVSVFLGTGPGYGCDKSARGV